MEARLPKATKKAQGGFTLIELMVVIAIVGVLAAVAIPVYTRFMYKARSAEATRFLEKMYNGAREYYADQRTGKHQVQPVPPQFPASIALTPAVTCCVGGKEKCAPDATLWTTPTWAQLKFAVNDPHYYRYEFVSSGVGASATFTARAQGDLDCDGAMSTFEMYGAAGQEGLSTTGSAAIYRENPLE